MVGRSSDPVMDQIRRFWQRTLSRETAVSDDDSFLCKDKALIETFVADQNNTYLVSFPRTGSHWLRMLMELYFGRPSLVRIFYYPQRQDYLTLHTHDLLLDVERTNVIYLYRDPIDTVYSQLMYHNEDADKQARIIYWSDVYGRHLNKWLNLEQFSTRKTIVSYEGMKKDLTAEFGKVVQHFGLPLDSERLDAVALRVTKDEVKRKTKHDEQVVQLQEEYLIRRQEFRRKWGALVWQVVTEGRSYLSNYEFSLRSYDTGSHR